MTERDVVSALNATRVDSNGLLALMSPAASELLEQCAQRAHELTRRHFGGVVQLFTPLYISNYCQNACKYCSFARQYRIERRHLESDEIRAECTQIAATGMRHVLLLTGEARTPASPEYIAGAAAIAGEFFSSIAIEVYPLHEKEYAAVAAAGVDGLTIYQEVYDRPTYAVMHEGGPKSDYEFRLAAPERACRAGIRSLTIGPLLGLADPIREVFMAAQHLSYIQRTYPSVELSISLPRMRPLVADFPIDYPVSDKLFVQLLTALRIAFPTVGITVSTRESRAFRDAILPMGVTKMSAGVSTAVGGRSGGHASTAQFEIADTRTVEQMRSELQHMGYQPVMHDWHHGMLRAVGDGLKDPGA